MANTDIVVLNTDLEIVGIIDAYESLIWTDRYWECGDFELYTLATSEILNTVRQNYYLQIKESEHTMIVEKIVVKSDPENGDHVTITGRSLESILDRRIIWRRKTFNDLNVQLIIRDILITTIINPSNVDRRVPNFIFERSDDQEITSIPSISAEYTGDNVYEIICNLCAEFKLGYKICLTLDNKFKFSLFKGKDRSYAQNEVPFVIFSPEFDNLNESNYIVDNTSTKNVTLIGGEGEAESRAYASISSSNDSSTPSGLYRRELFTDARDLTSDIEGSTERISESAYVAKLERRGKKTLDEHKDLISFEGEAQLTSMYVYKEDFEIGDVVEVFDRYNHESTARILEIVFSITKDGINTYPTFKNTEEDIAIISGTGSNIYSSYSVVADSIIEQGTSGIWNYTKYKSGLCELWGRDAVTCNIANQSSSNPYIYYSDIISSPNAPFALYGGGVAFVMSKNATVYATLYGTVGTSVSDVSSVGIKYRLNTTVEKINYTANVSYLIKTRWKQ